MGVKKLFDLTGRTALITGGSRGLGLQIGEALGELGGTLVITARKQDELDAAVERLAARNIQAAALVCDLSHPEAIEPMVEESLRRLGKIDILVNNAGATWGAPTVEHPLEAWNKVVALNLTAAFLVSQAVGKRAMLPAKYGKIINVASIAGLIGPAPEGIATIGYNTTKGGMINFTRALASEWAPHGVTVNAIAPGVFPSKMTKGMIERYGDRIYERVPMKRIGGPEDLKGLAALFASDASAYITGQTVAVDGGFSIV